MRRVVPFAFVAAMLASGATSAEPGPAPDPVAIAGVPREEMRCEELTRRLEALADRRAEADPDDVALIEAREIAVVANELRAEGDLPSAEALLEEAIALLEGAEPAS
jgi:hypothetical protein